MRSDRASARRLLEGDRPSVLRRLAVVLVLALVAAVGAGQVAVAATAAPAAMTGSAAPSLLVGPAPGGLPSAATEAPEAPEEDNEPTAPETDESRTPGAGPNPVVWFLAAAALLALGLGFVVMTRNQRTRV